MVVVVAVDVAIGLIIIIITGNANMVIFYHHATNCYLFICSDGDPISRDSQPLHVVESSESLF